MEHVVMNGGIADGVANSKTSRDLSINEFQIIQSSKLDSIRHNEHQLLNQRYENHLEHQDFERHIAIVDEQNPVDDELDQTEEELSTDRDPMVDKNANPSILNDYQDGNRAEAHWRHSNTYDGKPRTVGNSK